MASSDSTTADNLTTTPRLPKQKITAIARLKSFRDSVVTSRRGSPPIFPPPSWELDDETLGAGAPSSPPALQDPNFEIPFVERPEPISFANRLRGLIEALPFPGTTTPTAPSTDKSSPEHGKPIGDLPVPPGMDPRLVRMLSDEEVMNGAHVATTPSGEKEKERAGIWNYLAGLRKGGKDDDAESTPSIVEEEEGGVMMYAPLEPKSDSQLQLASSETLLEYVDEPSTSTSAPTTKSSGEDKPTETAKPHLVEKHVWVPSTTQLSLLATWWGYRLYLPPPVMAKLNSTSLKATARAAMITAALKFLLDKIPLLLLPPQLRPAMKMLKTLTPLVSYVGVFIAWSWDRVRALDKGNGVVMTATWLLPVALLPMAWDAGDIYRPLAAPTPDEMTAMQQAAAKAEEEERRKAAQGQEAEEKAKQKEERKKGSFFRW